MRTGWVGATHCVVHDPSGNTLHHIKTAAEIHIAKPIVESDSKLGISENLRAAAQKLPADSWLQLPMTAWAVCVTSHRDTASFTQQWAPAAGLPSNSHTLCKKAAGGAGHDNSDRGCLWHSARSMQNVWWPEIPSPWRCHLPGPDDDFIEDLCNWSHEGTEKDVLLADAGNSPCRLNNGSLAVTTCKSGVVLLSAMSQCEGQAGAGNGFQGGAYKAMSRLAAPHLLRCMWEQISSSGDSPPVRQGQWVMSWSPDGTSLLLAKHAHGSRLIFSSACELEDGCVLSHLCPLTSQCGPICVRRQGGTSHATASLSSSARQTSGARPLQSWFSFGIVWLIVWAAHLACTDESQPQIGHDAAVVAECHGCFGRA